MSTAAELLAAVDTAAADLEQAKEAVRQAIYARYSAEARHREAVEAYETWSKQALT